MKTVDHSAISEIFESLHGILGERFICTCGAVSTAAQMAATPGGQVYSAMFGHRPCVAIQRLWTDDLDSVTVSEC